MAGVAGSLQQGGIGTWRHRVSILRKDATDKNTLGQVVGEYEAIAEGIPARVQELSGRELERARQQVAEATYSIQMRCSSQVATPTDRIQYCTKVLAIGAVVTDETGMIQTAICYELKR